MMVHSRSIRLILVNEDLGSFGDDTRWQPQIFWCHNTIFKSNPILLFLNDGMAVYWLPLHFFFCVLHGLSSLDRQCAYLSYYITKHTIKWRWDLLKDISAKSLLIFCGLILISSFYLLFSVSVDKIEHEVR